MQVVFFASALLFPSIEAAVHSSRGAREVDRNASRSGATKDAMDQVTKWLRQRRTRDELFHDPWSSPHALASDQRQWLRLMIEAEWFG